MSHRQEEIELETDRELLKKVTAIANRYELSAESYISSIIEQYVSECISAGIFEVSKDTSDPLLRMDEFEYAP